MLWCCCCIYLCCCCWCCQVLTLAGELLGNAEVLLRDGLHTSEIADGYQRASDKALAVLESLVLPGTDQLDAKDKAAVSAEQCNRSSRGSNSSCGWGWFVQSRCSLTAVVGVRAPGSSDHGNGLQAQLRQQQRRQQQRTCNCWHVMQLPAQFWGASAVDTEVGRAAAPPATAVV
ncbi:hypothetical protein COO60DRAFT_951424 [Scenedesmus sp. NREL 46B-D3]|nr:hypothetical protein COO60DRAFT_951424 [Scenedesmus sp. NREL 46B-D3]